MDRRIAILGSGAMATASAVLLSERSKCDVRIWTRTAERAAELLRDKENRRLLPGVPLPPGVRVTHTIADVVDRAELIVAAVPTRFLRETLVPLAGQIPAGLPVVSVAKGLEIGTLMRPSEIILDVLGCREVAALGGPSHAEEIARRMPAGVVAASADTRLAAQVQQLFNTDRFRVYTNDDIVGVELAGAIKNVIAIAAGICDGLGFGDNAKSGLVTRGLVEMIRFGTALGAKAETFNGLAGLGDLVTTCFSRHSRNRHVGECLGKGQRLDQIVAEMNGVAEGITTTRSMSELASQRGIEMPIAAEVYAVLFDNKSPAEATASLMMRPPRDERQGHAPAPGADSGEN
ncbi:MAG TPA: NAD(P)H-dependent glycerol-3-phosphate dehydrogenase [Planctomycetaceae bacterium]|jgi:glycerol-3-phosphate dehydrogenase (NAD(P)+)|nr:NAD(P)H-dependent glycerol-3-phosphate dehydrogenase [Planctomycetaceae bacterium]